MRTALKPVLLLIAATVLGLIAQERPTAIQFQPQGASRRLPVRLFGANAIPTYERLLGNPQKLAALKRMNIAYTRFPGGTDSNYYQPESGKLFVPSTPNPSDYKRFWMQASQGINRAFPQGFTVAQFKRFSDDLGAEMVLVPNIDTSSVSAQRAWFQDMARQKIVPQHIEMGNEMYLAMLHDPATLAKFPDEPTTMRVIKQYYDAIHDFLPSGAKVAVQAAPENFSGVPGGTDPFSTGFRTWNDALHPEDWFQAATVHVYARVGLLTSHSSDPSAVFRAAMARYDEGVDRLMNRIVSRLPGKEIWVTEFNPRGGDPGHQQDLLTPAMQMHAAARACFAFLRHPEVAVVQYFMLNFEGKTNFAVFVRDGDAFRPLPVVEAMSWFNNAANGGVDYRGFVAGAKVPGGGMVRESFDALEGGLFTGPNGRTLLVQNATASAVSIDLAPFGTDTPTRIESLAPSLTSSDRSPAEVLTIAPAASIALAPYSLTRVIWSK